MQLENRYLNLTNPPPADVDVLQWWRRHHREYPLIAKCTRKYLCVQTSSASSERVFSSGGAIVTCQRTKLDVENLHMLVYCKENLPKVKISAKFLEDEAEENAEEELLQDKTTEVLIEGSAKIHFSKGGGKGNKKKLDVSLQSQSKAGSTSTSQSTVFSSIRVGTSSRNRDENPSTISI
ncbi:uncharacterized protein LOC136071632 [Hydra vulgaris]|uniref:uncharacterized protein LOC136071632 n=1 Tax=Hydra vulgaris TaxID=6087 RepID=UPI001F5ED576|nr:uncharacterized protein LOC105849263 [Hydra vulgaris]